MLVCGPRGVNFAHAFHGRNPAPVVAAGGLPVGKGPEGQSWNLETYQTKMVGNIGKVNFIIFHQTHFLHMFAMKAMHLPP